LESSLWFIEIWWSSDSFSYFSCF